MAKLLGGILYQQVSSRLWMEISTSVYGKEQLLNRARLMAELSLRKSILQWCIEETRVKRHKYSKLEIIL